MTRRIGAGVFAALILLTYGRASQMNAQSAPVAQGGSGVTFNFVRVGLPVPKYALSINEDGAGMYSVPDGSGIERTFTITSGTAAKIFRLLHGVRLAPEVCASKAKNVADTGTKTLTQVSAGTSTFCVYNFSENKAIQQLTTIFEGMAETLDEGRTLERLHRFDRLGLDAEMISFSEEVADGRALEPAMIAEELRSIADDTQVIQRVRTRAEKLLAMGALNAATP